ncbi:MAG: DNA mismatch repair endonuclease MutL [Granulosicoccaceae bacterium]|jgi:DNA mismatch repair protein MutL
MQRVSPDRIHLLPEQLANQIAAGEVVERPASVVKELVENSLDAGATRIEIDVEEGGRRAIHVQDDGCGIHVEDLPLAVTRHATSKLRSFDDLVAIASLGFRGEALPSIASVSRFNLCSRYRDSDKAYRINIDARGQCSDIMPDPQPGGTRISVEELFINTPARRRFLRSARTEFVHIQDVVMRAALSRFDVAFMLTHNGRQVLRLPAAHDAAARQRRLMTFCGRDFVEHAQTVESERDGIRVHGWVVPAVWHRAQTDRQFVFVNGRMMRDRMLLHAIRQAYGESLPPGRSAMFAIYIELDPARVDVNVHPTKHEVRFRELRNMHDLLYSAVQQALQQGEQAHQHTAWAAAPVTPAVDRVRETSAPNAYTASPASRGISQGMPRNKADVYVHAVLPGPFALVKDEPQTWLYDMRAVAQQVFGSRARQTNAASLRPMLMPYRAEVTALQAQWLASHEQALLACGVELTCSGAQTILCRAISALYDGINVERFMQRIIEDRVADQQQLLILAVQSLGEQPGQQAMQALLNELAPEQHNRCRRAIDADGLRRLYQELPQ